MPSPDTTRFGIRRGDEAIVAGLVAGFAILRVLAVRSNPLVYFDSGDYRHVDLTGGGRRPFTVPLLFWFMPSDRWRVVEQAVVSALAFLALAFALYGWMRQRWVGLGAMAAVLALGLTTQITNWDSAILSDSFTISLTVLLVAVWLMLQREMSARAVAAVLAVTLLWTFTRELHVYFTAVVAALAVVIAFGNRSRRALVVLAAGLVVISVIAVVEDSRNHETSVENIAGVIGLRILPDNEARAWFVDQGMPFPSELPRGQSIPRETLQNIPEFEHWLEKKGLTTYAKYLLTHPVDALSGPYGDLLEERVTYAEEASKEPVMLSPAEAYGRARPVLPPVVEEVLFDPGRTGAILTLTIGALVGAVVARIRGRPDRRQRLPLLVMAAVAPYLVLVWDGSVFEPGRHAMPGAVALRCGVIVLVAVLVDGWLAARAPTVRGAD
jgi:hypothetical protein